MGRRRFMRKGLAAAAVAGTAAAVTRDYDPIPELDRVEENDVSLPRNGKSVLLVGGGLSGLVAGCELIDRGFDVTILEKNATLGGRLRAWRDKDFGKPKDDPNWPGYPIEHGTHIFFNFYRNFRDFMARHDLSPRERPLNFPDPCSVYAYPDGTIDKIKTSKAIAPAHTGSFVASQTYVPRDKLGSGKSGRTGPLSLLAFDPANKDDVAHLDSVSLSEWAQAGGMSKALIHSQFDPLMDMGNFLSAEESSALYCGRLTASVVGHWKDLYSIQFLKDSTDDSIFQPLARYLQSKGGKIVFHAELDEFVSEGDRIKEVRTRPRSKGQYICPICGQVHGADPTQCARCGWRSGGFEQADVPARSFRADYYVLGVDVPHAKRILSGSPFKERNLYPRIHEVPTSSVRVLYLWYPRVPKKDGVKTNWSDHFGGLECLMTADFPMLATTLNLSILKADSYGDTDADIIEVQIARDKKGKGMTEAQLAKAVDADLRKLIPGLPGYTDTRLMRWDNFSCGTPNTESARPPMRTVFENFYLTGDWIALEHNCFLMEKVNVNARRVVNYLLDDIGQTEGKMTILPSETSNVIVQLARKTLSTRPKT